MGEELYFLIGDINALGTDPESLDWMSMEERQQCAGFVEGLEVCHDLIYSPSDNYKHGLRERNVWGTLRRPFFGGLSEVQLVS